MKGSDENKHPYPLFLRVNLLRLVMVSYLSKPVHSTMHLHTPTAIRISQTENIQADTIKDDSRNKHLEVPERRLAPQQQFIAKQHHQSLASLHTKHEVFTGE